MLRSPVRPPMSDRARLTVPTCLRSALFALACLALAGCTPMLVQVLRQDPRDPDRYVRVPAAELAGAATVYRGGRPLPLRPPVQLQPGDVIQTGPDAVAQIRYPEGHQIFLDVNTRVRLGSFFIDFGRIFARARGFFEAESDNVVAGVEGTEFVFEVSRDRADSVTVLDGAVLCRSRTRSWAPVRLRRGERFHLFANAPVPEKRLATRDELEDIGRWIKRIEGGAPALPPPARDGFCCVDGRVFETSRERCGGRFYLEQAEAERACQIDRRGFCCVDARVFESSRERCRGDFFLDRRAAEEACRPPPETGYCCSDGEVRRTSRERCRGRFYLDQAEAERACQMERPGFCCADGRVFETSREQCGGRFFPDRGSAEKYCRPPPESGYCCIDGQISQSTREQCRGTFYRTGAEARIGCRRPVVEPPPRRPPLQRAPPYEITPQREPPAPEIE